MKSCTIKLVWVKLHTRGAVPEYIWRIQTFRNIIGDWYMNIIYRIYRLYKIYRIYTMYTVEEYIWCTCIQTLRNMIWDWDSFNKLLRSVKFKASYFYLLRKNLRKATKPIINLIKLQKKNSNLKTNMFIVPGILDFHNDWVCGIFSRTNPSACH